MKLYYNSIQNYGVLSTSHKPKRLSNIFLKNLKPDIYTIDKNLSFS